MRLRIFALGRAVGHRTAPISSALSLQTCQQCIDARLGDRLILIGVTGAAADATDDLLIDKDR